MKSFHFRYSWISKHALGRCFPASTDISQLVLLCNQRTQLLSQYDQLAHEHLDSSRDLRSVLRWFSRPTVSRIPAQKTIKRAKLYAHKQSIPILPSIVDWVAEAAVLIRESTNKNRIPYDEILIFLDALNDTTFPVLLLWSQPTLNRLFTLTPQGQPKLSARFREFDHHTVQAALTCIGYALSGVGRMSPRGAWIGAGFGICADTNFPDNLSITSEMETVSVNPDLTWIDRNWIELERIPLTSGTLPWDYLRKRIRSQQDPAIRKKYQTIFDRLVELKEEVECHPFDFPSVSSFLQLTDDVLRASVREDRRHSEPHRWQVIRYISQPFALSRNVISGLIKEFDEARNNLVSRELLQPKVADFAHRTRLPYPLRLKAVAPESILLESEEFFDWIVVAPSEQDGSVELPYFPESVPEGFGLVFWLNDDGYRLEYVEPNPRRPAERVAAFLKSRPLYCVDKADSGYSSLKPPDSLIDNRLVRLPETERDPAQVSANDSVLYYSSLLTDETAPLIQLELQSPRYAKAPDLVPQFFSAKNAERLSFGVLCRRNRIWLISKVDARNLCTASGGALGLATFYYVEVHQLLGTPKWLDLIIEGKRSCLPTHSLVAWLYLLHIFRTTEATVAVLYSGGRFRPPIFCDDEGNVLTAQVILR